jgi:hypothetical protein
MLNICGVTDVNGTWDRDFVSSKKLRSMQFIATLENTLAGVCSPNPHLFEMTKNGNAVSSNGMADARNDGIKRCRPAFVHDINAVVINEQREAHWIENIDIEASISSLFNQAPCRVKTSAARQDG